MPVDGLGTDEPLTEPVQRKKDFEAQLMAGCTTIGVVSLATYFMSIWPYTVFHEYTVQGLVSTLAFGGLPACVFGAIAARKLALAGASGFFGGSMASAVFMHLRLQQTMLGYYTKDIPRPEYPESTQIWLPIGWFVLTGLVSWIFCRRESETL